MQPSAQSIFPLPDIGAMLDETTIRHVRDECERLATLLRQESAAIEQELIPLVDEASLPNWRSLAQISYEVTRQSIGAMLTAAGFGMRVVATQYEAVTPLLDGQVLIAETF